jgi:hypothetical protein
MDLMAIYNSERSLAGQTVALFDHQREVNKNKVLKDSEDLYK